MTGPSRIVFVVVGRCYSYDDERWEGDDTPIKALTERSAAEAHAARCRARIEGHPCVTEAYRVVEMEVAAP